MTNPEATDLVRVICERLIAAGWSHTENGQRFRWANLTLDTPSGKLEVEHMRDWWMLKLSLRTEAAKREVEVEIGRCLDRFLDVLIARQADLGLDSWPSLIGELREASCLPGAFSTFVLEFADGSKGPYDLAFATADFGTLMEVADDLLDVDDLGSLTPTLHVWLIEHGALARGIDLYRMISARSSDGSEVPLDTENRERLAERTGERIELALDRSLLLAAIGRPLPPPLLEGSRLLCLRVDGDRPDSDRCSNLAPGLWLHRGYQDLAGRVSVEELRYDDDGALGQSLEGLPTGLDDLDPESSPEELRAAGWEL